MNTPKKWMNWRRQKGLFVLLPKCLTTAAWMISGHRVGSLQDGVICRSWSFERSFLKGLGWRVSDLSAKRAVHMPACRTTSALQKNCIHLQSWMHISFCKWRPQIGSQLWKFSPHHSWTCPFLGTLWFKKGTFSLEHSPVCFPRTQPRQRASLHEIQGHMGLLQMMVDFCASCHCHNSIWNHQWQFIFHCIKKFKERISPVFFLTPVFFLNVANFNVVYQLFCRRSAALAFGGALCHGSG